MSERDKSEILIPFIGAFSSGKSSLLNALLDETLLSTDITPETALPIELRPSGERCFVACWPDGRQEAMPEQQFLGANFAELASQDGWLNAHLPNLETWPNLVLVDLPGWSSGQSAHERHIDEYLQRLAKTHLDKNTLFIVAVAADEGALRDNVRERLQQLDIGGSPYLLVLTKSDKRTPEDLTMVSEHLQEAVTAAIGKPPKQVLLTSARKKQVAELRQAIDEVQKSLKQKKPSVDIPALVNRIDRYIQRINDTSDDRSDVADEISEDVWDRLDDKDIDRTIQDASYSWAKHWVSSFVWDVEEAYEKALKRRSQQHFPSPDDAILADLEKLELEAPDQHAMDKHLGKLRTQVKQHVVLAYERAKPGFFASDKPEAVGERMRSNVRNMRDKFRAEIRYCANLSLRNWANHQRDEWLRLRGLISGA